MSSPAVGVNAPEDRQGPGVTVHQWAPVLGGIAVALLSTWLLLITALAIPTRKRSQLETAHRQFSSSGALPLRDERLRLQLLVVAVLVILSLISLGLMLLRVESTSARGATPGELWSGRSPSPALESRITPPSTTTPGAGNSGSGSAKETIQLEDLADSARPFEAVRIQGRYHGGADTFLRVQRWEAGKWLAFPVPTKTDQSGQFTTRVEFGQPGRYQLRVLDPNSGVTSKTLVLVITA
jgi:hypothetical protein